MPEPIILIITTGSGRVEKQIEGSQLASYTIGRGTDAALFLNDSGISRHHCRLCLVNGNVTIEDTQSTSGTWLNGERIDARARLRDGDEVRIGGVKIEIRIEAERAAAAAEATVATPSPPRQHPRPYRAPLVVNQDATLVAPAGGRSYGGGFGADELLISPKDLLPDEKITLPLNRESLVIGRDPSCDLPLNNLMISRRIRTFGVLAASSWRRTWGPPMALI